MASTAVISPSAENVTRTVWAGKADGYIGTGEDDLPTTVENLVNDQSEIFFFKTFRSWFFEYPKNQLLSAVILEQSHWSIANIALIGRWTSLQVERFHWLSSVSV